VETTIDCVVAPVDQTLPVADEELSVIGLPGQNELGPLRVGVGGTGAAVLVTTNGADVAEQPPASVTVTVYVPAVETMIDCVVAPVDQRFPVAEDELSVIVLSADTEEGPLIAGVAAALTVTTNGADVAEPRALVTVTVYVPAAETVIDCVVAPVDQWFPDTEDEVSVIVPAQSAEGPLMIGVGAAIPRPESFQTGVKVASPRLATCTVLFMAQTRMAPVR